MRLTFSLLSIFAALGITFCQPVAGQCPTSWAPGALPPELLGDARCSTLWDPDAGGPLPSRLVVGGLNLRGGSATVGQMVMTWDGSQWQPLADGPGTTGLVQEMVVWNGQLVVAGSFTGGIALWNGSAWQALGPGLPITVGAMTVWNGNVVAFGPSGGAVVARAWNGSSWSSLPNPPNMDIARAAVSFQGELWVGGSSTSAFTGILLRWNGTAWSSFTAGSGDVTGLGVRTWSVVSDLYVAGDFTSIGGSNVGPLAKTAGGTSPVWTKVGDLVTGGSFVRAMHVRATSALGAAVVVDAVASFGPTGILQLSGSNFVAMGSAFAATSFSYYGGSYHATNASGGGACTRFTGTSWQPVLGPGISGDVRALTQSGSDMIVGGAFQSTAGPQADRIARWNGMTFAPLGTGIGGTSVDALLTLGNGDVVAGGSFTTAGGLSAANIARWNGSTWSNLGTGCDQQVLALARMPNGDVIAGGRFTTAGGVACSRIARWNGTTWPPLGFGMNGDVHALAVRSDGTLFAGGAFTTAGAVGCSHIAQWNGTTWSPLGFGVNGDVHALAVNESDEVVMTGAFTTVIGLLTDRCVRWTGSNWIGMGASSADPSPTRALYPLPNGDIVIGRGFYTPPANPDVGISRWSPFPTNGFGMGLESFPAGAPVAVRAIAQRADGVLVVGGDFGLAGGLRTNGLATLTTACPAQAASFGNGCTGPGGALSLTAGNLPWCGSTFEVEAAGLGAASFGLVMLSFGQILPGVFPIHPGLVGVVPGPGIGCDLLVASLDYNEGLVPVAGVATWQLPLTPLQLDPTLPGITFYLQVADLDFSSGWVATHTTNALTCTVGAF